MKRPLLFGLLLLLAACSGNGSLGLHFENATVTDSAGKPGLALSREGKISVQGREVGAFDSKGGIHDSKGQLVGRLTSEGQLEDAAGKAFASVDDSGYISDRNGLRLGWSKEGKWMNGPQETGFRMQPPGSEAAKALNIALYLYFNSGALSGEQMPER